MSINLNCVFTYPYDKDLLMRKQKSIRRELLARPDVDYIDKRIAVLCGSTVDDVKNILELFLLDAGIRPQFYQSEYNKFYEDAVFGNAELDAFQPDIIIVFTSMVNIIERPALSDGYDEVKEKLRMEMGRFTRIWEELTKNFPAAVIIQNNMDLSYETGLGSLDAAEHYGLTRFIESLNRHFADYAVSHENFFLHDLHGLAARIGLLKWHDRFQYYAYKLAMSYDVIPEVSLGLAKIIKGLLGKNKKCLVLDLDNTLWGGIIGDDGMEHIEIGHETPTAEAYTAFQEYVLKLKERGVILAVCSKNEEDIAKSGFNHPDSVLHVEDFVSFHANWKPKNINLRIISEDDRKRNESYRGNIQRRSLEESMQTYDDFLQSLEMEAEIDDFRSVYYDRIAQLTNKSNQFNLTTRRYTRADIEQMANDQHYVTLYGRLRDKFGDNGLISVVIGEKIDDSLHIRLWLMSCRVLKRGMEQMMLDALAARAAADGCKELIGYYYKTAKNKMVSDLYAVFGFEKIMQSGDDTVWRLDLAGYEKQGKYIALLERDK